MPYYRRRYAPRRRRNYRRKPRYAKPSKFVTYANTAMQALSLAKYVVGLVNVERKFKDIAHSDTVTLTPQYFYLTDINQGDTDVSRDGNQVRLKSIQFKGQLTWNSGSMDTQRVRMLLVRKKDTNGSNPGSNDILVGDAIDDYYAKNEIFNYQILIDKTYSLSEQKPIINIKWFKKQSAIMRYSTSGEAVVSQQRNGYFVMFLSTDSTTPPTFIGSSRATFIDN